MASALYGMIVTRARTPALYAALGVPDTIRGRFEMVVLHTIMVVDPLSAGDGSDREAGQQVFDLFCADMDRSLRELGIGDLSLPKRMKQMAESYYGRAAAYGPALATGDAAALARAIARNVADEGARPAVDALAAYAVAAARAIAGQGAAALAAEPPPFPDPAAFADSARAS